MFIKGNISCIFIISAKDGIVFITKYHCNIILEHKSNILYVIIAEDIGDGNQAVILFLSGMQITLKICFYKHLLLSKVKEIKQH